MYCVPRMLFILKHYIKDLLHVCMQSLTFLQLPHMSTVNINVIMHLPASYKLTCIDKAHVHAGMPVKFSRCMHACPARNYPKALSHCGHGHDLISVAQLSVINITDIRSAFVKHWHQSVLAKTPSMACHSREARRMRASMLALI